MVSTHTETEVFTVASDGNFIACNTQEEYMLFSAANEDGPIVTESRNLQRRSSYEPVAIFTPFGVLVRSRDALVLHQGEGGYNLLHKIRDR